jgi:hypothetical protein
MRHEMLTQRALFCIDVMAKSVTLGQHFVTCVVPPLGQAKTDCLEVHTANPTLYSFDGQTNSPSPPPQ